MDTIEYFANVQNLSSERMKIGIVQHTNPHSLIGRFTNPAEIANLATYLSSQLSMATNETSISSDGGVL